MEIRTKELGEGLHTGEEAGNNRLKALEGAFKPEKITQKGEQFTQKSKNALTEAASQEENADDAGEYATDKVSDSVKGTAAKAAAKTKQGAKKTLDEVRNEIKERRKEKYERFQSGEGNQSSGRYSRGQAGEGSPYRTSGNGLGTGRNVHKYQGSSTPEHSGNYRFSAKDMKLSENRFFKTEGGSFGTDSSFPGTGGSAPAGKSGYSFKAKPDAGVKVREPSVKTKTAKHGIRTAENTARKTAKKAAKEARKAAQRAAREAAKTAAKTTEKAAKATAKTAKSVGEAVFKAVSAVIEKLGAACAAGGPFAFVIIAVAVYIGVIMYQIGNIADKFLSIFSLSGLIAWEGDVENLEEMIKDAHLEPNPAVTALNESYHDRLDRIIKNNRHDEVVLENPDPDWGDILGFWAAWKLCENDGEFPDFATDSMEGLNKVFNDMVTVEYEVTVGDADTGDSGSTGGTSGSESGEGGAYGADEGEKNDKNPGPDEKEESGKTILTITVEQLSIEEMAELYELGEDGEDYIELMTDGSLFEVINIFTKYIKGYELPEETEESEVVSVRLVRDSPILSEHKIENPGDIVAVLGETLCEFDREAVCVINLKSEARP